MFEMELDSLVYVIISSATSISCEKWRTRFPADIFSKSVDFCPPGSPSSCFKDLETGKVRFNSISMRGFEKLDEWQKLDHRKICKKAFSHLVDLMTLMTGIFWNPEVVFFLLGGVKRPRKEQGGLFGGETWRFSLG